MSSFLIIIDGNKEGFFPLCSPFSQDYATPVLVPAWSQYLSWLLQGGVKKAARKCRRLVEWVESLSPGDFLMRWGDPEAMWVDKAGTAGTEMYGEKEKNVENLIANIGCWQLVTVE